jgi:hypothetical protein
MKQNNHLEEQIRKALENLEASYDPGSWGMLEQRLDDAINGDSPANTDELIARRLGGLQVPFQLSDWDAMEQLLDAEQAIEQIEKDAAPVDNVAYDKLHRLEVPFQQSHWQLMAKRLEEEFSLRAKLYRYKVMEAALLLLLLLTIIRFLPLAEDIFQNKVEDLPMDSAPAITPDRTTTPSSQKIIPTPINDNQIPFGQPTAQASEKSKASTSHSTYADATTGDEVPPASKTHFTEESSWSGHKGLTNMPLTPSSISSLHGDQTLATALSKKNSVENSEPISLKSEHLLAIPETSPLQAEKTATLPLLKTIPQTAQKTLRFSIFSTVDYNYVYTPAAKLNILGENIYTDSDTTAASGYGGGILVSLKTGKWEYQTGGIYSFKRYIPNTPVFLFETVKYYIEEDFNGIQLDLLQLPLNVHYHFKDNGKWRLYAMGGTSANFITSSVYEIKLRRVPTFAAAAAAPDPDDPKKTIRKQKDFPDGIFDGGSLDDNFYMTANIGLGIERFVSPRWSLFFQPNYQHYLLSKGIGTNKDKIYLMSFYLGTKVSLK